MQQLFGNVLRRRRTAADISQEDLAGRANLDRTYVSMLERGKRMPSIEVVRKLAQGLGTTMVSLIADLEAEMRAQDAAAAQEQPDGS